MGRPVVLAVHPSTTLAKLRLNANGLLVVITRIVEILIHTAIQTHKHLE